ncbi:MAG: SRPBCC domain-containing protein [Anaerolineae bacterium]
MGATLEFTLVVKAAAKLVYEMFTDYDLLGEWFSDFAQDDVRQDGYLFLAWNDGYSASGKFTKVEKDKAIAFSLRGSDEDAAGQVSISLSESDGSTTVKLKHEHAGAAWQRLWDRGLENLQSHLETGYDLRETRRPLMGVLLDGELSEERAKTLGVPVKKGVPLSGTIPNLSAAAAGLKSGDVIVSMAGKPTDEFQALSKIIREAGYRAGDSVALEYYRGADKHQVTLTFALRQVEPIPTPEEYAASLEKLHAELETEVRALFNDVPEDIAARRPAESEWSARETVAHLIAGQRWINAYISNRLADEPLPIWSANNTPMVRALSGTYGTTEDLLRELSRMRRETVLLVRSVPQEFLVKRGSWKRVYDFSNFISDHDHTHFEQIRKAIEAAREPAAVIGD